MSGNSTKGISHSAPQGGSILDRVPISPPSFLSEAQSGVDQLVGSGLKVATDEKMMASFLGAGLFGRFVRLGTLASASESAVAPSLLRWASHLTSLAGESAAFAGLEREFGRLDGHAPTKPFQVDWVRAAINLGSLKFLGGAASSENIIVQHLLTDVAMVAGQNAGYALHVTEKPQGSLAEQMVQAEGMNLAMNGSMALLHGFSPRLGALEKSVDLAAASQGNNISFPQASRPFLAELATEGPSILAAKPLETGKKGPDILQMSAQGPNKPGLDETPSTQAIEKPSARVENLIGTVIDSRYKILRVLGEGGMGVVFVCEHQELGKKFALKILRTDLTNNDEGRGRFKEEARAASAIGNPHIINISDFGKLPDGSDYFVMEYLEGMPLLKLVEHGQPVPVPKLLHIAEQLADGLAAAHGAGIVHRDLKPDNIFLSRHGKENDFVKILDFGLAKGSNRPGRRLTSAGTIFGTPEYMSPEQAAGGHVDNRGDIYSFGIILYEMASGRVPFFSGVGDHLEILTGHMYGTPTPLSDLSPAPQLPPGLEAVILKCLAKSPKDRYQTMEEVIVELEKVRKGITPDAVSDLPDLRTQRIQSPMERRLPNAFEDAPTVAQNGSGRSPFPSQVNGSTPELDFSRKKRWPLFAGLGAGAALILGAVLFVKSQGPKETGVVLPPVPTDATPKPEKTTPAPAPTIVAIPQKEIILKVEPSDAHIFKGDQDLGSELVKVPVDEGSTVELEIRREGYKTKTITLDSSKDLQSVKLEKEHKSGPRPSSSSKSPAPSGSGKKPPKAWDGVKDPWKDPPPKN